MRRTIWEECRAFVHGSSPCLAARCCYDSQETRRAVCVPYSTSSVSDHENCKLVEGYDGMQLLCYSIPTAASYDWSKVCISGTCIYSAHPLALINLPASTWNLPFRLMSPNCFVDINIVLRELTTIRDCQGSWWHTSQLDSLWLARCEFLGYPGKWFG